MVSFSRPWSARETMRSFFSVADGRAPSESAGDVVLSGDDDARSCLQASDRSFTTCASDCSRSMRAPTSFTRASFEAIVASEVADPPSFRARPRAPRYEDPNLISRAGAHQVIAHPTSGRR